MTNHHTALATLERTERTLKKDDQWAKTYKNQMDDMVDRCVARKLAIIRRSKELDWPGVLYLPFSSCKSAFQFYARKNCVQLQPNAQRCFIKCLSRKRSRQLHEQPGWYSSTLERGKSSANRRYSKDVQLGLFEGLGTALSPFPMARFTAASPTGHLCNTTSHQPPPSAQKLSTRPRNCIERIVHKPQIS